MFPGDACVCTQQMYNLESKILKNVSKKFMKNMQTPFHTNEIRTSKSENVELLYNKKHLRQI